MTEIEIQGKNPSEYLIEILNEGEKAVEEDLTGKLVWCPHDALVWSQAEVISVCDENVSGKHKEYFVAFPDSSNHLKRFNVGHMHKVDPTHVLNLENLCDMNDMHEAPLLDLLRRRFSQKQIYTYTGDVLISINPYERFPELYSKPTQYLSTNAIFKVSESQETIFSALDEADSSSAPHVYQVANRSFSSLSSLNEHGELKFSNQSIIISGESGAGKTENSKHVLHFLIEANNVLCQNHSGQNDSNNSADFTSFEENLKSILVQSSVILEAFGNAKTVRNDNSSRFGKYIKLLYVPSDPIDDVGGIKRYAKLVSSSTETFLLEKSRLVSVGLNERNYHIFYQLIAGFRVHSHPLRDALELNHPVESFAMLFQGQCGATYEDAQEFKNTVNALRTMNCSDEEIDEIWKLLAIVLHLGNFIYEITENESVKIDCTTTTLAKLAELLGLSLQPMLISLTTQQLMVARRTSIKVKVLNATEVANNVLALLKWLYSKLFEWLVRKINYCHNKYDSFLGTNKSNNGFIGILDIFGFEILGTNSFEQLCINYTNECLQQQFNEYVFITEQQMYAKEGLEWSNISFRDNQAVLDVIASPKKPMGLLYLLEEQGMLNRKPDDTALLSAFNAIHDATAAPGGAKSTVKAKVSSAMIATSELPSLNSNIYVKSRFGTDIFTLRHFAGEVVYNIEGFLAKNNDSLQDDLMNMLRSSDNIFLRNVMQFADCAEGQLGYIPKFEDHNSTSAVIDSASQENVKLPEPAPIGGKVGSAGGKKMANAASVSLQFRQQLEKLMQTLRSTSPNYIKCIKPNGEKVPVAFDAALVIQQLRYSGVLEVVRIRREGFPLRMSFHEYYSKFSILAKGKNSVDFPPPDQCDLDKAKQCVIVLTRENLHKNIYQIGNSLLFLRHDGLECSKTAIKLFYARHAIAIQSLFRGRAQKQRFLFARFVITKLQALWRQFETRRYFLYIMYQIRRIQGFYKSIILRRIFLAKYAELKEIRRLKNIVRIQSNFRRHREMKKFRQLYLETMRRRFNAIVLIQSHIRMYLSKCIFLQKLSEFQQKQLQCAILLQAQIRRFILQRKFEAFMTELRRKRYHGALLIQSQYRRFKCQKAFRYFRQTGKAVKIQTQIRKKLAQLRYQWTLCCAFLLQSHMRAFVGRLRYRRIRSQIIKVQALVRQYLQSQQYDFLRTCVIVIQAQVRQWRAQTRYFISLGGVIAIQSVVRMYLAKSLFAKQLVANLFIQKFARRFIARSRYLAVKAKAIQIQSRVRCYLAAQHYAMQYVAILAIQAFGRMVIQRQIYQSTVFHIITIQTVVRRFVARSSFVRVRETVVQMQKIVRGFIARGKYQRLLRAIQIQKNVRRFLAYTKYQKLLRTIRIQRIVRGHLAYTLYHKQRHAIIAMQSFGRMIIAVQHFQDKLISTIFLQAIMRGKLARMRFAKTKKEIITLQAWTRMMIHRFNYIYCLASVITIQSMVRCMIQRNKYHRILYSAVCMQTFFRRTRARLQYLRSRQAIIKLQSFLRMTNAHNRFYYAVYSVIVIAKYVRRFLAQEAYAINYMKVVRVQIAVKRFLTNVALSYRLTALHHAANGMQHVGNTNSKYFIINHLAKYPEDRLIRYKARQCCTLFQSLLIGKQIDLIKSLAFTYVDAFEVDILGRNSAHYLCLYPNMEVLYTIASDLVNSFKYLNQIDTKNIKFGEFDDNDNDNDDKLGITNEEDTANNQLKQMLKVSVGTSTLKAGWLKKKRGGMMWQKRWVVLTEDYIIYYKSPQATNNPKFAIPLTSCSIHRLAGSKDPILEIVSSMLEEKKTGFFGGTTKKPMLFLTESEQELQEWMMPMRAVAGAGTLRSSSVVHYVNTDLRALWVNTADKTGHTPLHWLVRHAASTHAAETPSSANNQYRYSVEETVKTLAWLIEFGCEVNAQTDGGETALHVAIKGKVEAAIVQALLVKGSDLKCKDDEGNTPLDVVNKSPTYTALYHETFQSFLSPKAFSHSTHSTHSTTHSTTHSSAMDHKYVSLGKLKGYSYLSIYFSKHVFQYNVGVLQHPSIVISCYNGKKQLIEAAREVRDPVFSQTNGHGEDSDDEEEQGSAAAAKPFILWGQSFHMQTPLENIDSGSYLLLEFRPFGDSVATPTQQCRGMVSVVQYSITSDTIDSGLQSVLFLPNDSRSAHSHSSGDDERSSLTIESVISQRNRPVDLQVVQHMTTPSPPIKK